MERKDEEKTEEGFYRNSGEASFPAGKATHSRENEILM